MYIPTDTIFSILIRLSNLITIFTSLLASQANRWVQVEVEIPNNYELFEISFQVLLNADSNSVLG